MSDDGQVPQGVRVVSGTLVRKPVRGARRPAVAVVEKAEPVRRPAKVARMLALAHHLQDAIDRGAVADRAAVAAKLRLTRARLTQLLDLLLLAPDLQAVVLSMEAVDGVEPVSERALRTVAHAGTWAEQREAWRAAPRRTNA